MKIEVFEDLDALSRAAAQLFIERARHCLLQRGRFDVVLAGGDTPRRTYELIAERNTEVTWTGVHVWWGDERCVPESDPRSNVRMAHETLLEHVSIPSDQVHPIDGRRKRDEAARLYEEELRRRFGGQARPAWDLVLLGLGTDGHTASLFPGQDAVQEEERWVVGVPAPGDGPDRVTLTPAGLNGAGEVVFLVAGAEKAEALKALQRDPADPRRCPAQAVNPPGGPPRVLADQAAVS